jgi:hypothetical protein
VIRRPRTGATTIGLGEKILPNTIISSCKKFKLRCFFVTEEEENAFMKRTSLIQMRIETGNNNQTQC